ncbi:ECF transporter S component [Bacillus pseudomycoides]|uniref:ECF transporter S component n=1 Tax=Bacillus pseudomycoides TaxID=64104 RepID=A0AA91ZSJ2_9BACI|nr:MULTISPECIES: ECF transporter S component [Bacillus]PEB53024.1 ECF transporter S component [Bacillus sp. AFS098217]PED81790.1 ECF transporter S component [Bacillus pseudomycoides]PEU15218.1 ECF transporter S component [Bacillus sp. AFS014408]PEU17820.1 ECF transporter S component [Bacillus sp. AFS019443]PFW63073.1 ECF transporter S component [Bacillus sp. AFS075034]
MSKRYFAFIICIFIIVISTLLFTSLVIDGHYIWCSLLLLVIIMLPFYIRFEKKAFVSREIVMVAILAAIAAVSRVPFSIMPSVQPTSFVIIVSAIVFGSETGFMIGATAAIVSNIFLGQGPWTPWQMFAWGMIGFMAGLLRNTCIMKKLWGRIIYGFIVGFIFGWIMNLWGLLGFIQDVTWKAFLSYYAASFYFDLGHAISNVIFLTLFSSSWITILTRFKKKYGILDDNRERISERNKA